MSPASLEPLYTHIRANEQTYIKSLAEAVAIPSVSSTHQHREHVHQMGKYLFDHLSQLGCHVETHYPGKQTVDGVQVDLPPIVMATYPKTKAQNKKTVLVYGHYDVQPAEKSDGWATEPFKLTESNGKLLGRGSTDDKGPILSWLHIISAHQQLGLEFPVNLKMIFEGMEESGSEGLDDLIHVLAKPNPKTTPLRNGTPTPTTFTITDVDCVCISDNYWLGTDKPCITYGLRGISSYFVTIEGPGKDLHSGVFGGTVYEPMNDLVKVLSKLVDVNGKILVDGIYDQVAPLTDQEKALYDPIQFSLNDIHIAVESKTTIHTNPKEALMARWRYPSLSVHGVEGAFANPGFKTVIPAKVTGKFSIRLVPNMDPQKVNELVKKYVEKVFKELGSGNKLTFRSGEGAKAWMADTNHWNYQAATKATEKVWNVTPDFTREGGSIPVTLTFQEATGKSVLLLPVGKADDGAHSVNEKLDKENYIKGIMLLATYLHEVAASAV